VSVLQVELNLLVPEALDAVLPAAERNGVGVVARQALAGGLLLRSPAAPGPHEYASRDGEWCDVRRRLKELEKTAVEQGVDVAQMALQFLLQTGGISTTLIGTTSADHLKENVAALRRPELPPEVLASCSLQRSVDGRKSVIAPS
jgi:aryl-alcohol dehydrogenase-like predicted oxidoreductase